MYTDKSVYYSLRGSRLLFESLTATAFKECARCGSWHFKDSSQAESLDSRQSGRWVPDRKTNEIDKQLMKLYFIGNLSHSPIASFRPGHEQGDRLQSN